MIKVNKNKAISILLSAAMCFGALLSNLCSMNAEAASIKYEYGVFLDADPDDIHYMESYKKIVLDAQEFSKKDIKKLQDSGHIVYSYINIGSIEKDRDYFNTYKKFALGKYVNWPDEVWIDVSQSDWQEFIVDKLAKEILDMGVDGLWVDNCDVYYNYKTKDIYNGVTAILKGLKKYGTYIFINGGDIYIKEYARKNNNLDGIMDAVNQETVFSAVEWDNNNKLTKSQPDDTEYFQNCCKFVSDYGKDVYLLEYTKSDSLIKSIKEYCNKNGYTYYAAKSIDLKAPGQTKGSQPLKK